MAVNNQTDDNIDVLTFSSTASLGYYTGSLKLKNGNDDFSLAMNDNGTTVNVKYEYVGEP